MRFIRRHWYDLGGVVAIITAVVLALLWREMDVLQRLLLLNFIAILLHQYEEYGWPGGEPAIMNMVIQPSPNPNRYPLNQNSAMVVNVLITYGFYLIPVFFPKVVWLGLAPVLMGMLQFVIHGIVTNVKLKSLYNPGLGAVVLGHIPLGILYVYDAHAQGLMDVWTWVIGIVLMFAVTILTLPLMTYKWLADPNSPFVFDEVEMKRFSVPEKLKRIQFGKTAAAPTG